MEQDEKDIVLEAMVEYLCLVKEVISLYIEGKATKEDLQDLVEGMDAIIKSSEEGELDEI